MLDRRTIDPTPLPRVSPDGPETELHDAFEHAAIGIAIIDLDGRWLRANGAFCRLVGRTEAELRDLSLQSITHPDDLAPSLTHLRRLIAGQVRSYTLGKRYLRPDGRAVWVLLTASAVLDADGSPRYVIGQIQDLGEREAVLERERGARRAAERDHARLAALFAHAPTFMCALRGPDHVFESANPAYYQLVGFRDIIGKPVRQALPEICAQGFAVLLDDVLATGEPFVGRARRIRLQRTPGAPPEERFVTFVYHPMVEDDGARSGVFAYGMDVTEHVRAAEALRESETRFRHLAEQIDAVFYLVDAERTRVTYVSPAYERIWGRPVAELYADPLAWHDAVHPDDRARVLEAIFRHERLEPIEFRIVRPDGQVRWVRDRAFRIADATPRPYQIAGIIEDVTEQKRIEEELRASRVRYERHAANVPGLVFQFLRGPDGRVAFPFLSEGAREIYGLDPEAIRRDPSVLIDLIHPDDREAYEASVDASESSLTPWQWEGRVRLPDGRTKYVRGASRPERQADGSTLWDGLLMDVTDQREAAARLAESEQRLRSLVDHNLDAVISVDLDGTITGANPATETILGWRADELVGRPFALLVAPDHLPRTVEHFRRAAGGEPQIHDTVVLHRSGRPLDVVASSVPIAVEGRVVGVYGLLRDVTEPRSLQAQLRQAQKMEAVGRLAGGIAHDFNNQLTAILANAELVLAELGDGPVRADVEEIRRTAERAAALIRQLLAFSRKQLVEPRLVDLNAVVRETERMLHRLLHEGVRLETDLARSLASVLADPGQLEQVLLNLAVNAQDAMPRGGTLRIRTRSVIVDEPFAARYPGMCPGAYVTLEVSDTGVGIPPELLARIFEPFFTTKPPGEGTGLGLATVYGIVKQYGGYTAVRSVLGEGTTFTIYLPRQEGLPPSDAAAATIRQLPSGTETILVVEDEPAVRSSIRRILVRYGYTVIEARHGAEALRIMDQTEHRAIDLVMTDLVMPEMGGREFIAALRTRSTTAPKLLVMSGYDERGAGREDALPAGTSFLDKPFTIEGLLRAVRAALDADADADAFADRA